MSQLIKRFIAADANGDLQSDGSVTMTADLALGDFKLLTVKEIVGGNSIQFNIRTGNSGGTSNTLRLASGTGTTTGDVNLVTANASAGNSGSINLFTGSATGTRGSLYFTDGSEGTAGHVWTSTDVNGKGAWAPAPGGGDFFADGSVPMSGTLQLAENDVTDVKNLMGGSTFDVTISTAGQPGVDDSRSINLTTGLVEGGTSDSGNILLQTGEITSGGTGDRGFINMDALFAVLPKQSANPTHASLTAGAIYYNTSSNKIKMYNGSTWETVTSA